MKAPIRSAYALVLAVGATGLGAMPVWILSAHAPAIGPSLGFGEAELGLLISAFFAVSAVGGFLAGKLVQARGWSFGVALTGLIAASAMGAIGAGPANVWFLGALLCVGSVANACSQPAANLAIAESVPVRRQGLAFGIKQGALPIATLAVGASLPLFLGESGWRWAYAWAAVLGVLLWAAALAGPQRRRRRVRSTRPRLRDLHVAQTHRRALLLLSTGAGLAVAATMSLAGFLVVSVVADGWAVADAGRLLALVSVVGITSRFVSGLLADRRDGRHLLVVAAMMLVGVVGMLLLAVGGHPAVTVAGATLAFGLGWSWNGVFALAIVRYSGGSPAMATGMSQSAMATGASLGPMSFGLLSAWHSYAAAWIASAVVLAAGAVVVVLGRRALPR